MASCTVTTTSQIIIVATIVLIRRILLLVINQLGPIIVIQVNKIKEPEWDNLVKKLLDGVFPNFVMSFSKIGCLFTEPFVTYLSVGKITE